MMFPPPEEEGMRQHCRFGSKLAMVMHRLKQIATVDPDAKCLVYCQWNSLKAKVNMIQSNQRACR
eukprot:1126439-Pyramimonas_sp.AAC.1